MWDYNLFAPWKFWHERLLQNTSKFYWPFFYNILCSHKRKYPIYLSQTHSNSTRATKFHSKASREFIRPTSILLIKLFVSTTATLCCTVCQTAFFERSSRSRTPPHVWSPGLVDAITSRRSIALAFCSSTSWLQGCMSGAPVASGSDTCIPGWRRPTCDGQWSPSATFSRRQDMLRSMDAQQFRWPKF